MPNVSRFSRKLSMLEGGRNCATKFGLEPLEVVPPRVVSALECRLTSGGNLLFSRFSSKLVLPGYRLRSENLAQSNGDTRMIGTTDAPHSLPKVYGPVCSGTIG